MHGCRDTLHLTSTSKLQAGDNTQLCTHTLICSVWHFHGAGEHAACCLTLHLTQLHLHIRQMHARAHTHTHLNTINMQIIGHAAPYQPATLKLLALHIQTHSAWVRQAFQNRWTHVHELFNPSRRGNELYKPSPSTKHTSHVHSLHLPVSTGINGVFNNPKHILFLWGWIHKTVLTIMNHEINAKQNTR